MVTGYPGLFIITTGSIRNRDCFLRDFSLSTASINEQPEIPMRKDKRKPSNNWYKRKAKRSR